MNDEPGYGDIAPYAIYPGIHSMPANDTRSIWRSGTACRTTSRWCQEAAIEFNQDSIRSNRELDESFAAKRDPETLLEWGPEERRELREVAQEVWEEWSSESEMAERIYESHSPSRKRTGCCSGPPFTYRA